MKKLIIIILILILAGYVFLHGFPEAVVNWVNDHQATTEEYTDEDDGDGDSAESDDQAGDSDSGEAVLSSTNDIGLTNYDGMSSKYFFTYKGEEFRAWYQNDCWTIYDSYKITNNHDMKIICQALIDVHPVHGSDLSSYRTAEDMAYEWEQHNLAYKYLPEDSPWLESAGNVDLDPYDQGRSFEEIYEDRTGQEFDLKEKVKESIKDGTIFDKVKRVLFK